MKTPERRFHNNGGFGGRTAPQPPEAFLPLRVRLLFTSYVCRGLPADNGCQNKQTRYSSEKTGGNGPGEVKQFFLKVSTIILAVFFFLGLLEVAVRVLNLSPPRIGQADPVFGYAHIPGASQTSASGVKIEIGAHGFRGEAPEMEKEPGLYRVVFLGDSFLFAEALPWQDVFTTILNDRFKRRDLPIQAINMGVNGYGTIQEYLVYKNMARRYKPDLVVICFYAGNDLRDNFPPKEHLPGLKLVNGKLESIPFTAPRRGAFRDFLRRRLRIYSYLPDLWRRALNNTLYKYWGEENRQRFQADKAVFDWRPPADWAPDVLGSGHMGSAWRLTLAVLGKLLAEIRADGADPALCVFPIITQVYDQYWSALKKQYPPQATATWDRFKTQKTIQKFCYDQDCQYFPVSEVMVDEAGKKNEAFYLESDFHFNPRAHLLLADLLEPALEEMYKAKAAEKEPAVGALE